MLSQYAESIIEILYLPPKDRTTENCRELMGLLSKVDFFGKIFRDKNFGKMSHRDIYLKLFSNLRLEVYKPGDFIYKVGEPTNFKVYVLLKGNIGVYQA